MKRILVVRAGGLGDTVLCLPAIEYLQTHVADEVQIVGYPAYWAAINRTAVSIDGAVFAGLYSPDLSPDLVRLLDGVDLLVAWTASRPHLPVPIVHASPLPPAGIHAADWLLQSVGGSGRAVPRLEIDPVPSSTIFLHPGSGAGWKNWPALHFQMVAQALRTAGYLVCLIEGPADARPVSHIQQGSRPFPVLRLPLPHLAPVLAGARLFIGNDSGVTHLAAAAGAPALALFGPTDPAQWAPRGCVRVLRACSRPGPGGSIRACNDPSCMQRLSITAVVEAALEMLAKYDAPGGG